MKGRPAEIRCDGKPTIAVQLKKERPMKNIKYVGMDVHKAVTVIVVLNEQGQVESLTQIKTKADNFRDYFRGLSGTTHVVLEEGGWSVWLYQLLKPLVSSVTVCEPRHNKLIGAGNKTDETD